MKLETLYQRLTGKEPEPRDVLQWLNENVMMCQYEKCCFKDQCHWRGNGDFAKGEKIWYMTIDCFSGQTECDVCRDNPCRCNSDQISMF